MKKNAERLRESDIIVIGGEKLKVMEAELSDVGKQGKRKCRIVAQKSNGEKIIIIRPSDYPIEVV